ncbi:MAG: hypothetical protein ABSA67_00060 [Candidatus Brocadiia bacterium]|jgi:hypothetical protein
MARMTVCAAVLVALAGTFCAAQDYAPAPAATTTPVPAPKPAGGPVFTEMQLQPGGGQPANGLLLTLIPDKVVLSETPFAFGAPLLVEPTSIHLLFRNVSGQPIVLDAYNLALSRLTMIVVGPEKESVVVTRQSLVVTTRNSLPIDFPQIEPGNPFVPLAAIAPLQFPGNFNLLVNYALYKPGEYKVQVVYSRPAAAGPAAWSGTVVSNTVSFRLVGPPLPPPPENATPAQPPETAPQPEPTPVAPPAPPAPPTPSAPPTGTPS